MYRYSSGEGTRLSVICQDDYPLRGQRGKELNGDWDCAEALDYDEILKALHKEVTDLSPNCVLFEGFKAFHDERVLPLMHLLIWLDAPCNVVRRRRTDCGTCTPEHFDNHIEQLSTLD